MTRWIVTAVFACAVGVAGPLYGQPQTQTPPPVPKPFPGATQTTTGAKPTPTATPLAGGATDGGAIDPMLAGIPLYPGVQLLMTTDLRPTTEGGKTQKLFVFGTNDTYAGIVNFYRTALRKNGEEVSRVPAIQQFDLGSFDANTMAQRPSVIVKDYTWPEPQGYLHADGKTEKRYRSLVQIIPPAR
jgi:hypothetical protein